MVTVLDTVLWWDKTAQGKKKKKGEKGGKGGRGEEEVVLGCSYRSVRTPLERRRNLWVKIGHTSRWSGNLEGLVLCQTKATAHLSVRRRGWNIPRTKEPVSRREPNTTLWSLRPLVFLTRANRRSSVGTSRLYRNEKSTGGGEVWLWSGAACWGSSCQVVDGPEKAWVVSQTGKATEWVQIAGSHKWVANESNLNRPFQLPVHTQLFLLLRDFWGESKLTQVLWRRDPLNQSSRCNVGSPWFTH